MTTVAIIGAGPLGRWLALSAARAGFRVLLEDVMPANLHHAQEMLRRELGPEYFAAQLGGAREPSSAAKAQDQSGGLLRGMNPPPPSAEDAGPSASLRFAQDDSQGGAVRFAQDDRAIGVDFVSTIEDAVRDADLAIDCVPDELESKLEIFWLLDRMAPAAHGAGYSHYAAVDRRPGQLHLPAGQVRGYCGGSGEPGGGSECGDSAAYDLADDRGDGGAGGEFLAAAGVCA